MVKLTKLLFLKHTKIYHLLETQKKNHNETQNTERSYMI